MNLEEPCPHPYHDGKHEIHVLDGVWTCKACGAQESQEDTQKRLSQASSGERS